MKTETGQSDGVMSDAEYVSLRQQITHYSDKVIDLTKFSIVTSVALLGFALGQRSHGWLIALLPLLVIIPLSELILNYKYQIARIASYLRVFYERFPYENRLSLARKTQTNIVHPSFEVGTFRSSVAIVIASIAASLAVGLWRPEALLANVISGVFGVIFLIRLKGKTDMLKLGQGTDDAMERMWVEIQGQEAERAGDA